MCVNIYMYIYINICPRVNPNHNPLSGAICKPLPLGGTAGSRAAAGCPRCRRRAAALRHRWTGQTKLRSDSPTEQNR